MRYLPILLLFTLFYGGQCKREEQIQSRNDFVIEGELMGSPVRLKGTAVGEQKSVAITSYQPPAFIMAAASTLGNLAGIFGLAGAGGTGIMGFLALWLAKSRGKVKGALDQVVEAVEKLREKDPEAVSPLLSHLDEHMAEGAKEEVKRAKKRKGLPVKKLGQKG